MKKWLFNLIPKKINNIIWGYRQFREARVLSYSQSGEDAIMFNFFSEKISKGIPGFYLDVGAFHPVKISNTCLFHKLGWKGINIDARPGSMEIFKKIRINDINVEMAISNKKTVLTYFEVINYPEMNSFSQDFIDKMKLNDEVVKKSSIESYRLDEVLSKYLPENTIIDFFSLDVEGLELEVLQSNNWDIFRPRLLAVEIHISEIEKLINGSVYKFLQANNYAMVAKTYDPSTVFFKDQNS